MENTLPPDHSDLKCRLRKCWNRIISLQHGYTDDCRTFNLIPPLLFFLRSFGHKHIGEPWAQYEAEAKIRNPPNRFGDQQLARVVADVKKFWGWVKGSNKEEGVSLTREEVEELVQGMETIMHNNLHDNLLAQLDTIRAREHESEDESTGNAQDDSPMSDIIETDVASIHDTQLDDRLGAHQATSIALNLSKMDNKRGRQVQQLEKFDCTRSNGYLGSNSNYVCFTIDLGSTRPLKTCSLNQHTKIYLRLLL